MPSFTMDCRGSLRAMRLCNCEEHSITHKHFITFRHHSFWILSWAFIIYHSIYMVNLECTKCQNNNFFVGDFRPIPDLFITIDHEIYAPKRFLLSYKLLD